VGETGWCRLRRSGSVVECTGDI